MLGNYNKNLISLILYRGDPSSGKSYVTNSVLKLFPPEDIYIFDSATAQALHYDPKLAGKKIIFLRELKEQQALTEFLKGFYDEDMIRKETIRDYKTKEQTTKTHVYEKMGIITTFSFEKIQQDLIDRSWVLIPNQKHDQTKRIIDFTLDNENMLIEHTIKEKTFDYKCFFISQSIRFLDFNYTVYISFINKIKGLFPYEYLNVRRDVKKLIQLIKIITIWNQKNRRLIELGEVWYLFAEYEDLEMALEICQDLFIDLVLHIDEIKRAILDFMEAFELVEISQKQKQNIASYATTSQVQKTVLTEQEKKYGVTEIFEELRESMGISKMTLYRKLDDLFYEGYIAREKSGRKWLYWKKRDYNLVETIKLSEMREAIDAIVEQQYIFYENKTEEILNIEKEEIEEGNKEDDWEDL